jgi:ABC-type multidrug transport system fused ATPase/permease subunit
VASLLLGLCRPDRGRLLVGDVDLAGCDEAAWRSRISWVPQHPTLFRGTIADNIRLGVPRADAAAVRAAARSAGAAAFVELLPDGYETVVGEGGRQLSAGERRRIALARALLRDGQLVILDEPTADLDPESAELVAAALEGLRGRTVLLVAHDASLARLADRVVRLEAGRVAAVPA